MATLLLQDGTLIKGKSFGFEGEKKGEIVFNTSMTGYQEIISDPSYANQIVVMTYPEIGNYGLNEDDFESDKPFLSGLVVKNYSKKDSHYKANQTLEKYLVDNKIPALEGVDTRSLVKKIREIGAMSAFITNRDLEEAEIKEKLEELKNYEVEKNIIDHTSTKEKYIFNSSGSIDIGFIDYGTKRGILESLGSRGAKLTVYPCNVSAKEILDNNHAALFLSNGPGDPANYTYQIEQIKELLGKLPIFGICLGYQLLALSADAKTYKLKYGHRGGNHPVINLENNKVMMTSQNHGYAVDLENLPNLIRPTYKNLNDNTLEGFEISSLSVYAVQFHPESKPGPNDAKIIFDEWFNILQGKINEVNNER